MWNCRLLKPYVLLSKSHKAFPMFRKERRTTWEKICEEKNLALEYHNGKTAIMLVVLLEKTEENKNYLKK